MKLNLKCLLTATALLIGAVGQAETLKRSSVPADSKWVLHLDVDALRNSKIGEKILSTVKFEQSWPDGVTASLDLPRIIHGTHSITAYGADYESGSEGKGTLLWRGDKEIEEIANALLVQLVESTGSGESKVTLLTKTPFSIYNIDADDDMLIAVIPGTGLVLGRSLDQIMAAAMVLNGDADSLAETNKFTEYPRLSGGFFLMAFAESFSESTHMPPQAQVLKMAEGGRIAIGEENEELMIQLILHAHSEEVTQQIQQVIQGLLALATLGLGEEPGLQKIVRSAQVDVTGSQVKLDLRIPLAEVEKQIEKKKQDAE